MRETKDLEFKEALSDSFLKTVSAYANCGGGRVLFGVNDLGQVKGVGDPISMALRIEDKINDAIDPTPPFSLSIDDSSQVITLRVEEGEHKPYFYRSRAYRRSDSSTVEVDRFELMRLILEGQHKNYEDMAAPTQELAFSLLERQLRDTLGIEEFSEDTLKTLELFTAQQGFNIAGELLADRGSLPGIDMVRFGSSVSQLLERQIVERVSVLEQYQRALEMFCRYYVLEEIHGSRRETVELVPERAFREAVANALVHRAWDVPAHIKISMHPDRIEVVSPGGLPSAVSEEEYLRGRISILRNPILGNVFYRLGIIERFGTGVIRINEAYAASLAKPLFHVSENTLSVTLPLITGDLELSTVERTLLGFMGSDRDLSSTQLARLAGFGKTKTVGILNDLMDKGLVVAVGSGRATRYRMR